MWILGSMEQLGQRLGENLRPSMIPGWTATSWPSLFCWRDEILPHLYEGLCIIAVIGIPINQPVFSEMSAKGCHHCSFRSSSGSKVTLNCSLFFWKRRTFRGWNCYGNGFLVPGCPFWLKPLSFVFISVDPGPGECFKGMISDDLFSTCHPNIYIHIFKRTTYAHHVEAPLGVFFFLGGWFHPC